MQRGAAMEMLCFDQKIDAEEAVTVVDYIEDLLMAKNGVSKKVCMS